MTLWFALALMTAAAIFAVLWPLARRDGVLASGSNVEVYRDQIEEVRRDRAAGLIGEREAAAAEVEVSRRLIAAADAEAAVPHSLAPEAATRRRRVVSIAALVLLPFGALGLYLALGSPNLSGPPVASRSPQQPSIEQMVVQVETLLAKNPKEGRGWEVLAPIYLRLGRFDDAVKARRNAITLLGASADRHAGLGEALTAAAGGVVTAEALAEFNAALALEPDNVRARIYQGLAAEQDGRIDDAVSIWRGVLSTSPPDAPWNDLVRGEINRVTGGSGAGGTGAPAATGPSDEQVAAAEGLNPEQRTAMIRGMVERLAERLRQDGSDVEGWFRLVRSYMVLGEREKALGAVADARRALANDPEKLRRIEQLAQGLGLKG